jgi:hypothetical protein
MPRSAHLDGEKLNHAGSGCVGGRRQAVRSAGCEEGRVPRAKLRLAAVSGGLAIGRDPEGLQGGWQCRGEGNVAGGGAIRPFFRVSVRGALFSGPSPSTPISPAAPGPTHRSNKITWRPGQQWTLQPEHAAPIATGMKAGILVGVLAALAAGALAQVAVPVPAEAWEAPGPAAAAAEPPPVPLECGGAAWRVSKPGRLLCTAPTAAACRHAGTTHPTCCNSGTLRAVHCAGAAAQRQ